MECSNSNITPILRAPSLQRYSRGEESIHDRVMPEFCHRRERCLGAVCRRSSPRSECRRRGRRDGLWARDSTWRTAAVIAGSVSSVTVSSLMPWIERKFGTGLTRGRKVLAYSRDSAGPSASVSWWESLSRAALARAAASRAWVEFLWMKSSALKLGRFLAFSQRSNVSSISIGRPMLLVLHAFVHVTRGVAPGAQAQLVERKIPIVAAD